MEPPPEVLIVPDVKEIPWHAPVVPVELAVMAIALFVPVTAKLEDTAKPTPAAPVPVIELVAVTVPAVVNEPETLTPSPPPEPPEQFEKVTGPLLVNPVPKTTPKHVPPEPPEQLENVTRPVVPVVQAPVVVVTPWQLEPEELLVPLSVIFPVLLVTTLVPAKPIP